MADKIQVAVRVRPVLSQKKDVEIHWDASEKGMVVQIDPANKKRIGHPYNFDQVFGSDTSNYQIFNCIVGPLIDSAMKGFNVTVLAYGQTASGKTYTMMGSPTELGIVQLAVDRIFTVIENSPEREFLLRCSYIEIYNETIQDLLSSSQQKLKVQELAEGNVVVHNLIERNINSADAVIKLMQQGNKQRKVGGTSMNERSSRSHTIFRIIVESRLCSEENDAAVTVSHINLVDLAGSEKASQTNATGDRFREGCAINTSLSALSLVIKQLSEGEGFVNFRDSKLTHILRASLGGNARTAIICNVTPTILDETSSTLKFACSAKMVKNQPQVNEVLSDQALLRKYNNYIKDLEKKLKEKEHEKKPEAIEEMKKLLEEKDLKIQELKQQLVVSSSNESFVAPSDEISSKRSQRRMTWGGDVLKSFLKPAVENAPFMPSVPRPHRGSKFGDRFQPPAVTRRSRNNSFDNIEECADFESVGTESFIEANQFFSSANSSVEVHLVHRVDASTMTEFPAQTPAKAIGTPAPVLRERLKLKEQEYDDLREELDELCSFTRLEQQIGVHSYHSNKSSEDATEQLRQAQQTANDMEILYLDTQKKLSALQSEYREKQVMYEEELSTQKTAFQGKLETETTEKKSLAKELAILKDKCERLSRDQAEYDTHLAMITDRSAKREEDLRKNLQEAWEQLERLNGGANLPCADCSQAKDQVAKLEQQMKEFERLHQEAQQQIALNEERLEQLNELGNAPCVECSQAMDHVHQLEQQMRELEILNQEAQKQIASNEERLEQLSEQADAPCPECRQARGQIQELEQQLVELGRLNQEAQQQIASNEEQLNERADVPCDGCIQAVDQVKKLEQEMKELQRLNRERQQQIASLNEELARMKNPAKPVEKSAYLDDSLSGMCLADELRNAFEEDASFVRASPYRRPRKRPSSILSVTLAKMDHSSANETFDGVKRTRLSDPTSDGTCTDEIIVIRNHLIELQTFLLRYEEEFEILSSEKETLNNHLQAALAQIAELNGQAKTVERSSTPGEESGSLVLEDSRMAVEQHSFDVSSLMTDQTLSRPENDLAAEMTKLEHDLRNANNQIRQLHEELVSTSTELAEARESLEDAQSVIVKLQEAGGEQREELNSANEKLRLVTEEMDAVSRDLSQTRQLLLEAHGKFETLHSEEDELNQQLTSANEQIEVLRVELESEKSKTETELQKRADEMRQLHENLVATTCELTETRESLEDAKAVIQHLQEKTLELEEAYARISDLDFVNADLQQKTEQLEDACSRYKDLEGVSEVLLQRTEELDEAYSKIKELESANENLRRTTAELQATCSSLKELEGVGVVLDQKVAELEEARSRIRVLEAATESNGKVNEQLEILRAEVDSKASELSAAQQSLEEVNDRIHELQRANSYQATELSKANEQLCSLQVELASVSDNLTRTHQLLRDAESSVELKSCAEDELRGKLDQAQGQIEALNEALQSERNNLKSELRNAQQNIAQLQGELSLATSELLESKEAYHAAGLRMKELEQASDKSDVENALRQKCLELQGVSCRIRELEAVRDALNRKTAEYDEACSRISVLEDVYERNEKLHEEFRSLQTELISRETELLAARQHLEDANDEILRLQRAAAERHEELNKANEKIRFLVEELTATTDDLFRTRVSMKDANSKVELQRSSEEEWRAKLNSAGSQIAELNAQLEARATELTAATIRLDASKKYSAELEENYTKAREQIAALQHEIQLKVNELAAVCMSLDEASLTIEELQSRGDPQKLQADLITATQEIQALRGDLEAATDNLSKAEERIVQLSKAQSRGKSTPEPPIHVKLDLSVETLRRELAAAQARNETLRLSFETEEENRKKKVERLEKDNESLREQYARCKEELRLLRFRSSNEPTISVPKSARALVATQDSNIQTEPISDKGFGFRWQMEQYVADNDRLRKKVSDLGDRMEYYKSKLIKYRGMYQELTGQPETNPKTEGHHSPAPSVAASHDSPGATATSEIMAGPNVRQLRARFSAPPAGGVPENRPVPGTISSAEGFPGGIRKPVPGTHVPSQFSGQKKENLTKEEMEKINNCNPS